MMRTIKREDLACYSDETELKTDYKISDVVLGNMPDQTLDLGDEMIEYEIKYDQTPKNKLKNKCANQTKKGKKYQMHPTQLKRECVEQVN